MLLPFTYKKVGSGRRVRVSNHFHYSDFGIHYNDLSRQNGNFYVPSKTPGTGFMLRESNSHSYHRFVRSQMKRQNHTYLDLLFGREPSYEREIARVTLALGNTNDAYKKQLLECYLNALTIGKNVEFLQRVEEGAKRQLKRHRREELESIIESCKNRIIRLEKDMRIAEYHLVDHYPVETMEAYGKFCESFKAMIRRCRRVWHYNPDAKVHGKQVFFDMGIFDFIQYDRYLPLMRTSNKQNYFVLPDRILVVRSSIDYDIVPLKKVSMIWQEISLEEPTEMFSAQMPGAACMLQIPALDITFVFNHSRVVRDFAGAFDALKQTISAE